MKKALCALIFVIISAPQAYAAPIYAFPVANCTVTYTKFHHDYPATDIQAKKGCAFVAPINGVVEDEIGRAHV